MVHSGGLTINTLGGYLYPVGSPRCGSVQACWSKLVTINTLGGYLYPVGLPALRLGPNLLEQVSD